MEDYYILYHEYKYGEKDEFTERKQLGVFSSEEKVKEAIPGYMRMPGFCDYGPYCFKIIKCRLDEPYLGNIITTKY